MDQVIVILFLITIGYVIYFFTPCQETFATKEWKEIDSDLLGAIIENPQGYNPQITTQKDVLDEIIDSVNNTGMSDVIENTMDDNSRTYYGDFKSVDDKTCPYDQDWHREYSTRGKYYNTVERVQQLRDASDPYVQTDNGPGKNDFKGRKISEIYDELTKTSDDQCVTRKCQKQPFIDPQNHNQMHYSESGPLTIKNNQWKYHDECVHNGGAFDTGLYGHDPSDTLQQPI